MPRRQTTVERDIPLFIVPHMIMKRIRKHGKNLERVIVRKSGSHYYNISIRTRPVKRELKESSAGAGTSAVRIAGARGTVSKFSPGPGCVFSFMIRTPVQRVFVRIRYVTVLHVPVKEVAGEYRDLIALLRSQSGPGPDILELWTYNKHGSYRYFRIGDAGLIELDICGNVQAAGEPNACPHQEAPAAGMHGETPGGVGSRSPVPSGAGGSTSERGSGEISG
jgi:hypothetical protein